MKINAYKLTFSYVDPMGDGNTREVTTKVILANDDDEIFAEVSSIKSYNKEYDCQLENIEKVEQGKVWRVIMKGVAHHDEYERAEMEKTLFIDCKSMYDAELVAYLLWERQIEEEGFSDISIWSTRVIPAESKKEAA